VKQTFGNRDLFYNRSNRRGKIIVKVSGEPSFQIYGLTLIHGHNGIGITSTQQYKKEDDMKKIGLILVVFALFFGCASTGQVPAVGEAAPDFSITDVSGDEVRLSEFKGKKNVVLVFYADST